MKVKILLCIATVFCISANAQFKLNKNAINAGTDVVSAATLTDDDVVKYSKEYMQWMDTHNPLAEGDDEFNVRIKKIAEQYENYDGLKLNIKVYLVRDVNAFACADGSIRVCAGLMKIMTDNEVLSIVAHEIAHVKNKDSKDAMRTALLSSALKNGVASQSNEAKALSDSQLGDLAEAMSNSTFSREQESKADDYSYDFMKKNNKNVWALAFAFQKLLNLQESEGASTSKMSKLMSSHPETQKRLQRVEEKAQKDGLPKVEEK